MPVIKLPLSAFSTQLIVTAGSKITLLGRGQIIWKVSDWTKEKRDSSASFNRSVMPCQTQVFFTVIQFLAFVDKVVQLVDVSSRAKSWQCWTC